MGIVNVTPDSFSDGGQHADSVSALAHCERLLAEGADILDIGGESTRPGSTTPTEEEELARIEPVLRHAVKLGVPVSVDTSSTLVIRTALALGVDIINDVRSLQRPGALEALVESGVGAGVCVMHMQGEPATMQVAPAYGDVVAEVGAFLAGRLALLRAHGVAEERVVLDPGYGFGKTVAHNLELLQRQRELLTVGRPLLVGLSRKSCLGTVTGRPVDQRLVPSVAAALAAVVQGARVVRVHDVAETVDAMRVWQGAGLTGSKPAC